MMAPPRLHVARPAGDVAPAFPELRGERTIILNAETTGLAWWDSDRPIGWSWLLPESGREGYLPLRHDVGENLDVDVWRRWAGAIRGMHVLNTNTRFDLHMSRADGVDLTEQDNTFGDVAHQAALLDDHRMRFNLDQLSLDLLRWDVSADKIPSEIQSEVEFRRLPGWRVAPYAIRNVQQVAQLAAVMQQDLADQNLLPLLELEQQVIPVVVEMEKNGTHLDVELLVKWQRAATQELDDLLWAIQRQSGVDLESPDSTKDLIHLFDHLGLVNTARTESGAPSFTDAVLASFSHPVIQMVRKAGHLADLKSKYLDKYLAAVRPDGWLRFNLHQLRYGRNEDERGGTVSGRFSASGDRTGGYNPQQVVAVEKQLERGWCPDYVIRKLMVAKEPGARVLAADMMQVEYRLFGHYSNSANILDAYRAEPRKREIGGKDVWVAGPLADYHAVVWELLDNPALNRKLTKNINFAKIYGAGLLKFALMTGKITEEQYAETVQATNGHATYRYLLNESPYAAAFHAAHEANQVYDTRFPEVKPLLRRAAITAMPDCEDPRRCECRQLGIPHRGYVKDLMGRRARFHRGGRFHSALNRIIQGGAATVNKRALVEVYRERKRLGFLMRLTVHDEVMGDLAADAPVEPIDKLLNTQYFDLRVPILWDVKTGSDWAACK